ncbi:MAG TPA: tRNA (adenosine(37)-N6)-dimethylallyltransferase MiaA [Candidatus Limnocylindrales bacterium]|nr:tRNA (adenosine(37)-N6)-dimethylallyltransferase MiaA [Candidatus Limnocylindrales bacterium]
MAGATASGKTGLSLALAEAIAGDGHPAEIISADSRLVYRGMDVGTAKVTPPERARVPHHGLDLVEPDEPFSVAGFARHAREALAGIGRRRGAALLTGGTGLYLRAVARGLPLEESGSDPALRAELELRLAAEGPAALVAELRRLAPTTAQRVDLANPRRVVRALERAHLAGDVPPGQPRGYPGRVLWLGLRVEPAELGQRIAERAAAQFGGGLLDEAEALMRRFPRELPAFSAFGYREAMAHLSGELTRDGALEVTVRRTRAYARRQRTWFRAEPDIRWLPDAADPLAAALAEVRAFLADA